MASDIEKRTTIRLSGISRSASPVVAHPTNRTQLGSGVTCTPLTNKSGTITGSERGGSALEAVSSFAIQRTLMAAMSAGSFYPWGCEAFGSGLSLSLHASPAGADQPERIVSGGALHEGRDRRGEGAGSRGFASTRRSKSRDPLTFYGESARGNIDYPMLADVERA
jgi:hypothetical protein